MNQNNLLIGIAMLVSGLLGIVNAKSFFGMMAGIGIAMMIIAATEAA